MMAPATRVGESNKGEFRNLSRVASQRWLLKSDLEERT